MLTIYDVHHLLCRLYVVLIIYCLGQNIVLNIYWVNHALVLTIQCVGHKLAISWQNIVFAKDCVGQKMAPTIHHAG
jgi:hypothetical protein